MLQRLPFLLVSITATTSVLFAGCSPGKVDTSAIQRKWLDISYASQSKAQALDIYLPNSGSGPFPAIISIHGGGFAFGDRRGSDLAAALNALERGYAVVSIDYRLSGEAVFPKQIQDVKAAIRYIRAHAAQYNIDPEKLAAWGSSAGGNLAALAGTTAGVKELEDLSQGNPEQSSRVQAVVDWFGPVNFLAMDDQFKESGIDGEKHNTPDSFESRLLGRNIAEVPDLVKAANPETYISAESPPFFIQHGTADQNIPVHQSEGLAAKLIAAIGEEKVTFMKLEGAKHGGAAFTAPENIRRVLDFLDKHMK